MPVPLPIAEVLRERTGQGNQRSGVPAPLMALMIVALGPQAAKAWLEQKLAGVSAARTPEEEAIVRDAEEMMRSAQPGPGMALGRIGVLPGRERIASDIIKRGLKEPWFHGSPEIGGNISAASDVLRQGFDPKQLGATSGLRLGEPAGVSLTRSPEVARKFGDVLRVGVDIPPSSVGQFVDPEFQRLLRESYRFAGHTPTALAVAKRPLPPATQVMSGPSDIAHFSTPAYKEAGWQIQPGKTFQDMFSQGVSPEALPKWAIPDFNMAMSEYLRGAGVEGIAYNPRRWAEYEMRVLDPKKAVPLGTVPMDMPAWTKNVTPGSPTMERYMYGKAHPRPGQPPTLSGLAELLHRQYMTAPQFPVRLRDVLGIAGAD